MIDYLSRDRNIYEHELKGFLPDKIFDAHVHIFDKSCLQPGQSFPKHNCYQKFGGYFTFELWQEYMQTLLPEQKTYCNSFGQPSYISDLNASAEYSGSVSDNRKNFGMLLISPNDSVREVINRLESNRLIGYKPYLDFVETKAPEDVTIEDMLTPEQLQLADEKSLAITLHIPRPGRLADPLNQEQMIKLCRKYPNIKFIFAHIGRAYWLKNVVGNLAGIAECENAYIDTAMVNHEGVLEYAFRNFPRERILFGSDAPIALLRGKSIEINNSYAYLMAEDYRIGTAIYDTEHAVEFTSFFYEQLRGIKLASERAGLSPLEIENIFFDNAHKLFSAIAKNNYGVTQK